MHHEFQFQQIEHHIISLLESCSGELGVPRPSAVFIEIPKESSHGQLSSAIAFRIASALHKKPLDVAESIAQLCRQRYKEHALGSVIADVKSAPPGFVNFYLQDSFLGEFCRHIVRTNDSRGTLNLGKGKKVLLEFVSANPTGPLSIAHARQAALGDSLARILDCLGFAVSREYYNNDEGNQINILGRSLELRYRELQGEAVEFPEDHYQGDYIKDLAKELLDKKKKPKSSADFRDFALQRMSETIEQELEDFGVRFDIWYSQKKLATSKRIEKALDGLREKGFIYDSEGAVWFKSTLFGDDKDRVVVKSDSAYTYLAPDIAYHDDKFGRGFEWLINIWGPDHHGYVPRIKAAVQALGHTPESLSVIIVQLATIYRHGKAVSMSTRRGQYITLREVLSEVGKDAMRFFLLMRRTDSHLDFDLELAKKQSPENPVYYVQYAHARIVNILENAKNIAFDLDKADMRLLKENEEKELLALVFQFSYVLEVCLRQLDAYAMTVYLQALASAFHRFYDRHRVLGIAEDVRAARLALIKCLKVVLAQGLDLLGISQPSKM